jgi:hypothetical protein
MSKLGKLELAKFKVGKVRVVVLMHTKQKTQVSLDTGRSTDTSACVMHHTMTHDTVQHILFFY